MPAPLERMLVALIVGTAALYAVWAVMPQSLRLRLVTLMAAFPPTAVPAERLLQRWRAARGCAGCAATAATAAPARAPARGPEARP